MTDEALAEADQPNDLEGQSVELAIIPDLELNAQARTIAGLVLPYETLAERSSAGRVWFQAGAIQHHPDLKRIKLLVDHDAARSVGYCTSLTQDDAGVHAVFKVPEGPDGDDALAKAGNGVRDGLSLGCDIRRAHETADGDHTVVTAAVLNEVSLVSLPAFTDSRVLTVQAAQHKEGTTAMTETTETTDQAEVTPAPAEVTAAASPATPSTPAAPLAQAPAPYIQAQARPQSLTAAAQTVASIHAAGGGASMIQAALSDVVPGDDAGNGFIGRPSFLGELWEARRVARPVMESFGPIQTLTKIKETGWRWVTRPEVDTYAGNKTEIPSNQVKTESVDVIAERSAGGWDVDRIYVDLGDADMVEALFRAAIEDYALKSEAWAVGKVQAAATAVPASADLATALVTLGGEAGKIGATLGTVIMAPDVWAGFLGITRQNLPWWVNQSAPADLVEGTLRLGQLSLVSNPDLAAGTILAADRRAMTFKEAKVRVNAIDLPRGGVDLGVFAYHSALVHDERAIWSTTVSTTPEA